MFFGKKKTVGGQIDWVVVGLGNPGAEYAHTRHNVGFWVLDKLSDEWHIPVKKLKFRSQYGLGPADGLRVLLLKPQTYMNLSGEALRDCLQFYKVPVSQVIVVYDDAALPLGKLRIRGQGSDGGHNGLKSILTQCRSDAFPRIKVGIGAPNHPDFDLADWVLGPFSREEAPVIGDAITRACAAVREIMARGVNSAMNKYN